VQARLSKIRRMPNGLYSPFGGGFVMGRTFMRYEAEALR
jgi:hypothetical protein